MQRGVQTAGSSDKLHRQRAGQIDGEVCFEFDCQFGFWVWVRVEQIERHTGSK